jgi:hypothetical protein
VSDQPINAIAIFGPPLDLHAGAVAGPIDRAVAAGRLASSFATELTALVLPLTAVLMVDASAQEIGLLGAAYGAASLVLLLFVGALAAALSARVLAVGADLLRAGVVLLVPILAWTGDLSMGALYAVAAAFGALTVATEFGKAQLASSAGGAAGRSMVQRIEAVGGVVGAVAGGALVAGIRASSALVAAAVAAVVSTIALGAAGAQPAAEELATRQTWSGIRSGLRSNLTHPYLRALTLNSMLANFLAQVILVLFVLYAVRDLDLSAAWIGVIFGAAALGAVVGQMAAQPLAASLGFGRAFGLALVLYHAGLAATPVIDGPRTLVIVLLVVSWFLAVFGLAIANGTQAALRYAVVPGELVGQVFAAHRFLALTTVPLGALVAGFVAEEIGVRDTMLIAAALLAVPLVVGLAARARGLATLGQATE